MKGFVPLWLHIRWGEGRLGPRRKNKGGADHSALISLSVRWWKISAMRYRLGLFCPHYICSPAQCGHAWVQIKASRWYCWISNSRSGLYTNWHDRFWVWVNTYWSRSLLMLGWEDKALNSWLVAQVLGEMISVPQSLTWIPAWEELTD